MEGVAAIDTILIIKRSKGYYSQCKTGSWLEIALKFCYHLKVYFILLISDYTNICNLRLAISCICPAGPVNI